MRRYKLFFWIGLVFLLPQHLISQPDTVVIGFGSNPPSMVTASSSTSQSPPANTINQDGFLPNENAASRFLSQATLGYNYDDISLVAAMGIEDWIDAEIAKPCGTKLADQVQLYHQFIVDATGNANFDRRIQLWKYSWWQYHMTNNDALRQRVAFALSELIVVSENSSLRGNPLALGSFYDIFLQHAFGNFRDILQEVTYHPSMATYLTYMNNPKADTINNIYPDENYAREVMQLFTIGLNELNMDGTLKLDTAGNPIPTYDNIDIQEFSKIFTGLTWADRDQWGKRSHDDTSYTIPLAMWNEYHEPGVKYLLNGFEVEDRNPVDGHADISDALDNLFNHPNSGPYIARYLIQRLVTANPEPAYVERVANVFANNGQNVRGDMKAVIQAILLDPIAKSCASGQEMDFGSLREPFIRYFQINKAFDAYTLSGNFRNEMEYVYDFTRQRPLASPSVFNFFQQEYQPIGEIEDAAKVAPVFQITDAQTIAGWIDGVYRWIMEGNLADEKSFYSGESSDSYSDEITMMDLTEEISLADDDHIHELLDRLNLILAQGRLSSTTTEIISETVKQFEVTEPDDLDRRARLAIYLILSSPEYLINR